MEHLDPALTNPADRSLAAEPGRYEPPRLTGKQSLQQVTLLSGGRPTPGGPGQIGHP
jgi:hypothetical protein